MDIFGPISFIDRTARHFFAFDSLINKRASTTRLSLSFVYSLFFISLYLYYSLSFSIFYSFLVCLFYYILLYFFNLLLFSPFHYLSIFYSFLIILIFFFFLCLFSHFSPSHLSVHFFTFAHLSFFYQTLHLLQLSNTLISKLLYI